MLITFFNNLLEEDKLKEHLPNSKVEFKSFVFTRYIRLKKNVDDSVPYLFLNTKFLYREFCFGVLYEIDFSEEDFNYLKLMFCAYDFKEIEVRGFTARFSEFANNDFNPNKEVYKAYCFVANNTTDKFVSLYKNRHLTINYNKKLLLELYKKEDSK